MNQQKWFGCEIRHAIGTEELTRDRDNRDDQRAADTGVNGNRTTEGVPNQRDPLDAQPCRKASAAIVSSRHSSNSSGSR